jgi:hypothetical protein
MTQLLQQLYLPQAAGPKLEPTFQQTLNSAFNLENDLVNFYDMITKPVFEPDFTFDVRAAMNRDKLPDDVRAILARAQSEGEYEELLGRVRKE